MKSFRAFTRMSARQCLFAVRCDFDKITTLEKCGLVMSVNVRLTCFNFVSKNIRRIKCAVANVLGMCVVPPRGLIV